MLRSGQTGPCDSAVRPQILRGLTRGVEMADTRSGHWGDAKRLTPGCVEEEEASAEGFGTPQ